MTAVIKARILHLSLVIQEEIDKINTHTKNVKELVQEYDHCKLSFLKSLKSEYPQASSFILYDMFMTSTHRKESPTYTKHFFFHFELETDARQPTITSLASTIDDISTQLRISLDEPQAVVVLPPEAYIVQHAQRRVLANNDPDEWRNTSIFHTPHKGILVLEIPFLFTARGV
jgi:hypothetical protein